MSRLRGLLLLVFAFASAGCAQPGSPGRHFLAKYGAESPALDRVAFCWGYGCRLQPEVDMTGAWPGIEALLAEPLPNAAAERERVAAAVALWEDGAARSTPVGTDVGGTFGGVGEKGQLDCVDEAVNTTRLLVLLDTERLLKYHTVGGPATRGVFINGWPHTSAVLREKATGERYAIDSWFHDNGEPAEVVPIKAWLAGWSPAGGP